MLGLAAIALVWLASGSIEDRTLKAAAALVGYIAIFVLASVVHLRLKRMFKSAITPLFVAFSAYVASIGPLSSVFTTGLMEGIGALVIVIMVDMLDIDKRTLVRRPMSIWTEIVGGTVAVATLLFINAVGGVAALWTSAGMGTVAVLYWLWAQRMAVPFPRIALAGLIAISVGTLFQAQADRTATADPSYARILTYAVVGGWYFWMVIRDKKRDWNQ